MDAERNEEPAVTSSAWLQHYKAASRRRRASRRGSGFTRTSLKRQRLREGVKAVASTVGVFLLAGVFYLLLSR